MNKKSNCNAEQCWRIFTMLAKVVGTIRNQLTADCAFFVQYPKNIKIKTLDTPPTINYYTKSIPTFLLVHATFTGIKIYIFVD